MSTISMAKFNAYICDKWYVIIYKWCDEERSVKGYLVNYNGGDVVLLSKDGVYHIRYKDIIHMMPSKVDLTKYDNEFLEVIRELKGGM